MLYVSNESPLQAWPQQEGHSQTSARLSVKGKALTPWRTH